MHMRLLFGHGKSGTETEARWGSYQLHENRWQSLALQGHLEEEVVAVIRDVIGNKAPRPGDSRMPNPILLSHGKYKPQRDNKFEVD